MMVDENNSGGISKEEETPLFDGNETIEDEKPIEEVEESVEEIEKLEEELETDFEPLILRINELEITLNETIEKNKPKDYTDYYNDIISNQLLSLEEIVAKNEEGKEGNFEVQVNTIIENQEKLYKKIDKIGDYSLVVIVCIVSIVVCKTIFKLVSPLLR